YLINVGKAAYNNLMPSPYDTARGEKAGSLLIHESTHVWQGHNAAFSWGYVFNSLYNQIKCGSHAYDVDFVKLKQWDSYGVEQQATLVEHWFSDGSLVTDHLYPFVRDNVRTGHPKAHTNL